MALRGVQEAITVTAQAPVVETTTTEVATVVTQEQIEMLPIAEPAGGLARAASAGDAAADGNAPCATNRRRRRANANSDHAGRGRRVRTSIYNSGQEFLEVPQSGIP